MFFIVSSAYCFFPREISLGGKRFHISNKYFPQLSPQFSRSSPATFHTITPKLSSLLFPWLSRGFSHLFSLSYMNSPPEAQPEGYSCHFPVDVEGKSFSIKASLSIPMSHLVCPLCGKNAPLSTLNPDNLDLDLKVVSFRGLGRGKGFAKAEEHSVLGDDEISPIIARRTLQLCRMFIKEGLLKSVDVIETLSTEKAKDGKSEAVITIPQLELMHPTATESFYINQINELNRIIINRDYTINSLNRKINENNTDYEINAQVDYIIRNGVEVGGSENVGVDSNGWVLKINPSSEALNLYLYEVVKEIPLNLKEKLLQHVKPIGFPSLYNNLVNTSRKKSALEELAEIGSVGVAEMKDKNGSIREVKYESILYRPESYNSISMKGLEVVVSRVKELVKDPEKMTKIHEENFWKLIDKFNIRTLKK
jgi:hypothetical protein